MDSKKHGHSALFDAVSERHPNLNLIKALVERDAKITDEMITLCDRTKGYMSIDETDNRQSIKLFLEKQQTARTQAKAQQKGPGFFATGIDVKKVAKKAGKIVSAVAGITGRKQAKAAAAKKSSTPSKQDISPPKHPHRRSNAHRESHRGSKPTRGP